MIQVIIGLVLAASLFFLGYITRALSRLVFAVMRVVFFIADKLKIRVNQERKLKFTTEFYRQFNEINTVSRSTIGLKKKRLYSPFAIIIAIISFALIVANLKYWTGNESNIISDWIETLLVNIGISDSILGVLEVTTIYTAVTFSMLSFGLSSILKSWKESKSIRKERRNRRRNEKAIERMSSSELTKKTIEKIEKETSSLNTIDLV